MVSIPTENVADEIFGELKNRGALSRSQLAANTLITDLEVLERGIGYLKELGAIEEYSEFLGKDGIGILDSRKYVDVIRLKTFSFASYSTRVLEILEKFKNWLR